MSTIHISYHVDPTEEATANYAVSGSIRLHPKGLPHMGCIDLYLATRADAALVASTINGELAEELRAFVANYDDTQFLSRGHFRAGITNFYDFAVRLLAEKTQPEETAP